MSDRAEMFYKIVVPLLTLAVGILIPSLWSSRTLSVQELGIALQIRAAPSPTKEATEWADRTIAAYVQSTKETDAARPGQPPAVSEFTKDICLVPARAIIDRPPFYIDEQGDQLLGQDARIVLMKTINDYRLLAGRYDLLISILRDTCGFQGRKP